MSFNENSVMRQQPAGESEIPQVRAPIVSVMQQTNTEEVPSQTSLPNGAVALAWWDEMKYFWRKNTVNNGCHLWPLDEYVDAVLTEGDFEIQRAAKEFSSEKSADFDSAQAVLASIRDALQSTTGFDPSGVESNALVRFYRTRTVLARKIAGSAAVSANHRLMHAHATDGDIDAVKESDFYKSDLENCERWAFKACFYEYILSELASEYPDVITDIAQTITDGVTRLLRDEAIEKGNKLKRPPQAAKPAAGSALSAEELRQMRA